jgi:hypothetical protein
MPGMQTQIYFKANYASKKASRKNKNMIKRHHFNERNFIVDSKQTWTDWLRTREDPDYEIDDIF